VRSNLVIPKGPDHNRIGAPNHFRGGGSRVRIDSISHVVYELRLLRLNFAERLAQTLLIIALAPYPYSSAPNELRSVPPCSLT